MVRALTQTARGAGSNPAQSTLFSLDLSFSCLGENNLIIYALKTTEKSNSLNDCRQSADVHRDVTADALEDGYSVDGSA